ncbi:beta-Ig-H3/fasciclin [Ascodesmis nigricans]|uniref:Beta-Ig-H3/fasciclin n=1 Tax=Ascodesmis nigricans TaxID=341454 RepID=A0A4S2MSB1_9PEZI|nr:beta-Ig-H3/fasciclin [Ascodesmis nigricans]
MVSTKTLFVLATTIASAAAQSTPDIATLLNNPNLSTLKSLVTQYPELISALGGAKDLTVFAPSDDAFAKIATSEEFKALAGDAEAVENLLKYHVLGAKVNAAAVTASGVIGDTLLVDYPVWANLSGDPQVIKATKANNEVVISSGLGAKSKVTQADVAFTNGVAHIIDAVLTPPVSVSKTAVEADLTKLVEALTKANLVSTVDSLNKVTIFAPNDEAFGKLTSTPSDEDLEKILTYHVIAGTVGYSPELKDNTKLKTVNGQELTIRVQDGKVTVNGANVVAADVFTNNGVVHVIDT